MAKAISKTDIDAEDLINTLGSNAKHAAKLLAQAPTSLINDVLQDVQTSLVENAAFIIEENKKDLSTARAKGLSSALIDRLSLNDERIRAMSEGVKTVRELNDPTGRILWDQKRPNGLDIQRVSCPIGVLGMIYESRPNVTVDASVLCMKSHNAVILRGGSECLHSSLALHSLIQDALAKHDLPKACVSMIPTRDRDAVGAMLRASNYIDVMIPRGGHSLIERVITEARMPVFGHLDGLCHVYVHAMADIKKAQDVTLNAKMRRTGICGAMETLLLDSALSDDDAKKIIQSILESGCSVVGDKRVQSLDERVESAAAEDWNTEYLDSKLSCKFVDDLSAAVNHINEHGSHHTDSIITENETAARHFMQRVDSGIVMHNTSTQFADGGEFGMGAEIGIATGKMHARGPVGLEQLCTYKYYVHGNGQTRP